MIQNRNVRFVVLSLLLALGLLVAPLASAQTTMRPIEDFLAAQTCSTGWFEPPDGQQLFVDYRNYFGDVLGLGTTVDGYVKESARKKGGTKINVVLHTHDALTIGWDFDGYPIFGYYPDEVYFGADAAFGDSLLTLEFISELPPGSPLPDFCPFGSLGPAEITKISFVANADGPLRADFGVPEGTPGKAHTSQQGRTVPGQGGPHEDGFPAEKVRIWEAGN